MSMSMLSNPLYSVDRVIINVVRERQENPLRPGRSLAQVSEPWVNSSSLKWNELNE